MHKSEDWMIKGYRDLLVWQKAHELAKEVITHSGLFPLITVPMKECRVVTES